MTNIPIKLFQGRTPAENCQGITVIIDVIRAFTACHAAFESGVKQILLARNIDDAFTLKQNIAGDVYLAGEINALPIEGFDFGNSPNELTQASLTGASLVLKTTNGVEAALNSQGDKAVLVAAYANAKATVNYIKAQLSSNDYDQIQLVASHPTGDEDLACAEYMRDLLTDKLSNNDLVEKSIESRIVNCENAKKFFDTKQPLLSPKDIEFCARIPKKQFIMPVTFNAAPTIHPITI